MRYLCFINAGEGLGCEVGGRMELQGGAQHFTIGITGSNYRIFQAHCARKTIRNERDTKKILVITLSFRGAFSDYLFEDIGPLDDVIKIVSDGDFSNK